MKQLVLVAMLAALAASALTLLGVHALSPAGGEVPRPGPASRSQVGLADVVKEMAALRRELGDALRSAPPQASVVPSGVSHVSLGRDAAVAPEPRGSPPAEGIPSATRYTRMAETLEPHPRSGHKVVGKGPRARWMLRNEQEVLDWFGPPDRVHLDETGYELWSYDTPSESGIEEKGNITFKVHAGRVIEID